MKSKIILLILVIIFSSCTRTVIKIESDMIVDKRLIGTWQSDKDRTVKWLKENRKFSEQQISKIVNKIKLGTLKIQIKEDIAYTTYEGETTEEENNFVAVASNSIAVVNTDPLTDELVIRIITIEDEKTFSTYNANFDFREYFKKIE